MNANLTCRSCRHSAHQIEPGNPALLICRKWNLLNPVRCFYFEYEPGTDEENFKPVPTHEDER